MILAIAGRLLPPFEVGGLSLVMNSPALDKDVCVCVCVCVCVREVHARDYIMSNCAYFSHVKDCLEGGGSSRRHSTG